jgi:hypothetical protein
MEMADSIVLNMIEGEILEATFIEELLGMLDQTDADNVRLLTHDRDRLRGEIQNLVGAISLGKGAQPEALAQAIRDRELEVARIEVRLRAPRHAPDIEPLRDALTQRAQEWRATLRAEPKVARLLLRRLIGPLVLHDESKRPDFIEAVAEVKAGLIDGLAELPPGRVLSARESQEMYIQEVASPSPSNGEVTTSRLRRHQVYGAIGKTVTFVLPRAA